MAPLKEWDEETTSLIAWFEVQEKLPSGPFSLRSGVTVIDHYLFYKRLKETIACGPADARNITGALKTDLKDLKKAIEDQIWL